MDVRKTGAMTQAKPSNAAGVLQVGPNDKRIGLLLSTPAGRTTLVVFGSGESATVGPAIPPNAGPVLLTVDLVGTAIQGPFTLIDSLGAAQTFAWIEFVASL